MEELRKRFEDYFKEHFKHFGNMTNALSMHLIEIVEQWQNDMATEMMTMPPPPIMLPIKEYKVINDDHVNSLGKKMNKASKEGWGNPKLSSHYARQGEDGRDHFSDYTVIMERDIKIEIPIEEEKSKDE